MMQSFGGIQRCNTLKMDYAPSTRGKTSRELRDQFFPKNIEYIAREKLLALKQTGSIREYVRQFSALMLDIMGMSKKDNIFVFINGLQSWTKTKIYEKKVQDLATAIASAERLLDFGSEASFPRKTTQTPNTRGKAYKPPSH